MYLASSGNESDILCIFGWSISKSIEKIRAQHVKSFSVVVASFDFARLDWWRSYNTESNKSNFDCRRLHWKVKVNCQSRYECTTFKSSKECFHWPKGLSVRTMGHRPSNPSGLYGRIRTLWTNQASPDGKLKTRIQDTVDIDKDFFTDRKLANKISPFVQSTDNKATSKLKLLSSATLSDWLKNITIGWFIWEFIRVLFYCGLYRRHIV